MSGHPDRRPFTVDDLWNLKRVGAPAPLPGGREAIVPVASYSMESNAGRTRLWRVALDGAPPKPLTAEEYSSHDPAASPDGLRLAFVRKKDNGKPQLYVMPVDGGEPERLTDLPLGVSDPTWFPDGERIVFVSPVIMDVMLTPAAAPAPPAVASAPPASGPSGTPGAAAPSAPSATPGAAASPAAPPPEPDTLRRTREILARREAEPCRARITEDRVYRFWDRWLTTGEVPHLFAINLRTRALTDLTPQSTGWFDFMEPGGQYDLSPDGGEIAFAANASRPPHDQLKWEIFTVALSRDDAGNTHGGPVASITTGNTADDHKPRYSPDGRCLVYGMQRDPFFYADRIRLVRYDRATGAHTVLTEGWDRSAAEWVFAEDGRGLHVTAEDQARLALFRLPPAETSEVTRTVPGGTITGLSAGGGRLWFCHQDLSHPPEVMSCLPDGADCRRVTSFNDELLAGLDMGAVEETSFRGAGDRPVQMFVIRPPGYDPRKKWPLVHVIHGGPHGISGDQFHWRWNGQLFAAPGYVVAMVNFHGSTSFGQEFAASILGAHGDKPFADIMAATDHLMAQGAIDESRMAATGGSYGGYLVTWIAGQTGRFACLVNHAGVYDLLAQYASDVTQGRHVSYGGEPWEGLERIDRWSPARNAAGFASPMLILGGENDYRVPHTQGLEVYGVYRARGIPARLVSYPDENHWILSPRNSRHWYGEVLGWLARHLDGPATGRPPGTGPSNHPGRSPA